MKLLKIMYNSLLWAIVISITCFKSEWLEMRVNVGYILFVSFLALTLIFSIYFNKKEVKFNSTFTIVNFVVCIVYGMINYGFNRLKIVPASIIREGLNMTSIPFSTINLILGAILLVGLSSIILSDLNKKSI